MKETFTEIKWGLGLKEKWIVVNLTDKTSARKTIRPKTFKIHNNSVAGYEGNELESHLIQGNQT